MSEVPKTTFKFSDLPEELTELRKAVILMVIVYHNEKIQIKTNKGKRYNRVESRRNQG